MYLVGGISMCSSEGGMGSLNGEQTIRQERPEVYKPRPTSAPVPTGKGSRALQGVSPSPSGFLWVLPSPKGTPSRTSEKQAAPLGPHPGFLPQTETVGRGREGHRCGRGWQGQGCAHPPFPGHGAVLWGRGAHGPFPVDSP